MFSTVPRLLARPDAVPAAGEPIYLDPSQSVSTPSLVDARRAPKRFDNGSRVTRECHARFYERRRVKLPPPTHHDLKHHSQWHVQRFDDGSYEWTSPTRHAYHYSPPEMPTPGRPAEPEPTAQDDEPSPFLTCFTTLLARAEVATLGEMRRPDTEGVGADIGLCRGVLPARGD